MAREAQAGRIHHRAGTAPYYDLKEVTAERGEMQRTGVLGWWKDRRSYPNGDSTKWRGVLTPLLTWQ
jgi:hypothetical protein